MTFSASSRPVLGLLRRSGTWGVLRGWLQVANPRQYERSCRLADRATVAGVSGARRRGRCGPELLGFEITGAILNAHAGFVLHDDPAVLDLARRVVRRRLGVEDA